MWAEILFQVTWADLLGDICEGDRLGGSHSCCFSVLFLCVGTGTLIRARKVQQWGNQVSPLEQIFSVHPFILQNWNAFCPKYCCNVVSALLLDGRYCSVSHMQSALQIVSPVPSHQPRECLCVLLVSTLWEETLMECCISPVGPNSPRKLFRHSVERLNEVLAWGTSPGWEWWQAVLWLWQRDFGSSLCNFFLQDGNEKLWIWVLKPYLYLR